jgi:hypothetical protein
MNLTISIVESSVNLGQPVTVHYSSTGADDTQLNADCLSSPIDLGPGDQSGTIKFLPVVDGSFSVSIFGGMGDQDSNGNYYKSKTTGASVRVN